MYVTKQTIHRTTQKIRRPTQKLRRLRGVPRLCGFYPGICLTTEEKARKNLSQGKKPQSGLLCYLLGHTLEDFVILLQNLF